VQFTRVYRRREVLGLARLTHHPREPTAGVPTDLDVFAWGGEARCRAHPHTATFPRGPPLPGRKISSQKTR
jgi:hypothetical protein